MPLSADPNAPVTTLLVISGAAMPPYATRGVKQTLEPISPSSKVVYSVNGKALNLAPPQMRKYKSEISCTDQQAPAFCALWPGDIVTVDCVAFVARPLGTAIATERTVIDSYTEGNFAFDRYQLTMMVDAPWSIDLDEYGAQVGWKLSLTEA